MLSQTVPSQSQATEAAPRRRRQVRFPDLVNVAVSREISGGLKRICNSFVGLGYTESDIVRLALFEWLTAKGVLSSNGNVPQGDTNGR